MLENEFRVITTRHDRHRPTQPNKDRRNEPIGTIGLEQNVLCGLIRTMIKSVETQVQGLRCGAVRDMEHDS